MKELCRAASPLVVLCAPAGAGKSTLLRQWDDADERPFAWVRLDDADNDPVVLLSFLAWSLVSVTAVDSTVFESLTLAEPPLRERVLPLLAAAIAAAPPFVLALDDAHVLKGDRPWGIVASVLRSLPQGAQLALGSRSDPDLPMARLRVSGEVSEVRAADLAFDRSEVGELLRLHGREPDERSIDGLLDATEGWATGLQLACRAGACRPPAEWLPELAGGSREIAAYLAAEVLAAQPPELQEFLLRTSVLAELTPRLCAALTGRDDAGELLDRIASEELFVTALDDGCHYRYQHLFAEMLAGNLERRHPGLSDDLHRAAAAWYLSADQVDPAIRHLLAAGDHTAAGDLVAAAWRRLWSRGQVETVRRWLESFSDRQILGQPALTLTAGWVYTALDAGSLGERWGAAACDAVMDDSASPDGAASLRSSQALLRATIAPDGVRRMRDDAELAARLESTPGTSWHADAAVALGVARWLSGSTQGALHPLALGAREGSVCNPSAELAALGCLALIAADEAEWDVAAEYEARATALLAGLGFGTYRRCLPMLLARVKLLSHAADRAAADESENVRSLLGRMAPHPWIALLAQAVLGEAAIERADMAAAGSHAAAAAALLKRYPDAGTLRQRVERLLQAVERARLSEPLTPAERRVLELLPTHLTDLHMAEQFLVSHNTIKTHVKSLYRKLEVTSRADAVRRARDLGLLQRE